MTEVNNYFRHLTEIVNNQQLQEVKTVYNLQVIEERIMSLALSRGLSKNKLLQNAGLGKSIFDNMKKGRIPSVDKIHTLADYLDCSVDFLLGRTDNPNINK